MGGGMTIYEPDWSDKVEPYTSALAIAADIAGATASGTILGAPAGLVIAGLGNIPNFAVDIWQLGRDLYRGDTKGTVNNAVESALDVAGVGALKSLEKTAKAAKKTLDGKLLTIDNTALLNDAGKTKARAKAYEEFEKTMSTPRKVTYGTEGANSVVNLNHARDMFVDPFNNPNIQPIVLPQDNTKNDKRIILKK